jgi:hypothetical protein
MNTENYSHSLKNYLIGALAVGLIALIPIVNWFEEKYYTDPIRTEKRVSSNSDKSVNPEPASINSAPDSNKLTNLLTEEPTNSKPETPTQIDQGDESIAILNKPPPKDVELPRQICMVTAIGMGLAGIYANLFTNLENENCDIKSFSVMSLASADAQVSNNHSTYMTGKSGPYISTATKNLTVSDSAFTYLGSQKFTSMMRFKIGWLDILQNPKFIFGTSAIRRAEYFPISVEQSMNLFWSPGEAGYVLVSPNGDTYLMVLYTVKLLPGLNRYNLLSLEKLLILPPGWKYIKADIIKPIWLTTSATQGYISTMTYDNLGNLYVKSDLRKNMDLKSIDK